MSTTNRKVVENAQLVLENGILWDAALLLENDRIVDFGPARELADKIPEDAVRIDAAGAYVGPGFVDLHVHGGGGHSTYVEPVEASEFFLRHGSTTILATPSYQMTFEALIDAIRTVKAAMGKARTIRGIYMEGPFTNPSYGSHSYLNPWRGPIDQEKARALVDAAPEVVQVACTTLF